MVVNIFVEKLIEMKNVDKKFPGVYALKGVDFNLEPGEVHALLGENGAGKSTLMKILSGIYSIDGGDIYIKGEKVTIESVKDAQKLGISIIHQELALVPHLSIAENIYLGREPRKKNGLIDISKIVDNAQLLIDDFGLDLDAAILVNNLTIAQQQMVEIIKAVSFNSDIIIMDEPTSSLSDKEVEYLFKTIEKLTSKGVGIVYISHRMSELFALSSRITVLRDGQYIDTVVTAETTETQLISLMVGRELESFYTKDNKVVDKKVLKVSNFTTNYVKNINFELRKGEILGFAGLIGAGRSELMKGLFGLDEVLDGEILLNDKEIKIKEPNDAIEKGVVYVPENRKEEGLFLNQSIRFNLSIKILDKFIKLLKVNRKVEDEIVTSYINELAVKTPSEEQLVNNLSGGNQQKVLIAKWLATKPKVLILDEPTRGVDVGAKSDIYTIINNLANEGVSIIMVSSDLPEVINMSDRIVVMCEGEIKTILDNNNVTQENVMHYATGGS